MANDNSLEAFTATAGQTAEQMTKQTQGAMENYFGWLPIGLHAKIFREAPQS
jgi:hypothetical protein